MEIRELDFNGIEIKTGVHESEFLKGFLKDELLTVLENEKLKSSNLYIHKSYIYEKEKYIEFGIYIINTSEKTIFIKSLPLTIINGENEINEVLDVQEEIKMGQAIFRELKINKYLLKHNYILDNFEVLISNLNSLEKYEPIELELNIEPKFKGYIEDGYFVSLLFRN